MLKNLVISRALDRKKTSCSLLMKPAMCLPRHLFNDHLLCMLKSYSKSFENKKPVAEINVAAGLVPGNLKGRGKKVRDGGWG